MQIIKYKSIDKLSNHKYFTLIGSNINICASTSTADGMVKKYHSIYKAPILPINVIINKILSFWKDTSIQFGQYTYISKIIRQMEEENKWNRDTLKAARRNKADILESVRKLVECGVFSKDIEVVNEDEKLFKEIWGRMEQSDDAIKVFRKKWFCKLGDKAEFKGILQEALIEGLIEYKDDVGYDLEEYKNSSFFNLYEKIAQSGDKNWLPDKVILQGFYYITPLQDRFFTLLESLGIELIFLNNYDDDCSSTFKIWEKSFSEELEVPFKKNWLGDDSGTSEYRFGSVFGDIYEKGIFGSERPLNSIVIKKYANISEFAVKVDEMNTFYSPESEEMNQILREYFPERYKRRHLLSYPVGQYIFALHNMWDEEKKQAALKIEQIETCFASGWLREGSANAQDLLLDFQKVKDYFEDCTDIQEWKDRLELLKNIIEGAVQHFNLEDSVKADRYQKRITNMFLNISTFSVEENKIKLIYNFIIKIIGIIEKLFNENKSIKLNEYMKKLLDLIKESSPESFLFGEERNVVIDIENRLKMDYDFYHECFPEDIAEALMIFLGGGLKEGEEQTRDDVMVSSLAKIEGEILKDEENTVHVCCVNEFNMPGTPIEYTWPLSKSTIDKIYINGDKAVKRLIYRMRLINESKSDINRYLFYCALQVNSKLILSSITKWNDKEVMESIYVQMLREFAADIVKCEDENIQELQKDGLFIDSVDQTGVREEYIKSLPDYAVNEFLICPRRYFYSYAVDNGPEYLSKFHQGFVFTGMLRAVKAEGIDLDRVYKELEAMFPNWSQVEKVQLKDFAKKTTEKRYDSVNGIEYSRNLQIPYFLKDSLTEYAINCKEGNIEGLNESMFTAKADFSTCKYCPHVSYCRDALYSVDEEDENDK